MGSESPGPELFSKVRAADLADDGRLFVLDEHSQEIRVFGPNGEHVKTLGGLGDGPDEIRGAVDLFVSQNGRTVWALGLGWFKAFVDTAAEGFRGQRQAGTPAPAWGFSCKLGPDRLVLSGVSSAIEEASEYTLHEISLRDGSLHRSFGDAYRTDSDLVRLLMSVLGPVGCDPGRGVVAHAFEALPYLRLFRPNGELLWVSQLKDYRQMRLVQSVDEYGRDNFAQRGAARGTHTYDATKAVHHYRDDYLLWQVRRTIDSDDGRSSILLTHMLDVETGGGTLISNDGLPLILRMTATGYIAVREDPYPVVEVWALGSGESGETR